jgi:transcriptional regulator with XRE-family HTH domain
MSTREARKFGKALREIRKQRNLTQEELEGEIGAHTGYLSRVEAGQKNISITTVIRIAQALNIDVLFGDKKLTGGR